MVQKILKSQLLLFFTVSFLIITYNFSPSFLSDNVFYISSGTNYINSVLYWFSSACAYLDFYTGSWIIFAFLFQSFFYLLLFSKSKDWLDTFNCLFLISSMVLFFDFFYPVFLGQGLRWFLKNEITFPLKILLLAFAASLSLWRYASLNLFKKINFKKVLPPLGGVTKFAKLLFLFLGQKFRGLFTKVRTLVAKLLEKNSARRVAAKELKESENDYVDSDYEESDEEECDEEEYEEDDETDEVEGEDEDKEVKELNRSKKKIIATPVKKYRNVTLKEMVECLKPETRNVIDSPSSEYFEDIVEKLEEKLQEFKINGSIVNVIKGPVVDTFELELGAGVKVSKLNSITEDLSLALSGIPLRMNYPMRGRTTVGIEVPRKKREIIYLDKVLGSKAFAKSPYDLPMVLGKDAFGETSVVDLAVMPHMLVAGATGAGKSVFINSVLVSLLAKCKPNNLKLLLIDPKQLELALYSKLPHLLLPVVTDSKTALLSLKWLCQEMERRYSLLKQFQVRNIAGFNRKWLSASEDDKALISELFKQDMNSELPFIVVIVDEFADLILTKAGKEIENSICRLAAKARAAGIHLIVATQRPSVDVITGLIKSNFPTRVSFRVTSPMDSRTILNAQGSEKLLGKGDMLYKHGIETTRNHSAYVEEDEIEVLMDKLCQDGNQFDLQALAFIENEGQMEGQSSFDFSEDDDEDDCFYNDAVKIVTEAKMASASMLQRRLKIGYNRAANLVEKMEANGVVGPQQGSKPRAVLMNSL
jgi:S-DNA-T family DNA segregation ATPase FtsK/SpoIIIE